MNRKLKMIHKKLKITKGFVLPLVLIAMIILSVLAVGTMMTSYGSRIEAVRIKAETEAMLTAEAGYEQAIFWMSQQKDILGALQAGGGTGNINFGTSSCSYDVSFENFLGARPVFKVSSTGRSGRPVFTRIVDVSVMQETAGWAMGACRVPYSATTNGVVNFVNGEIIDMPLHINKANDSPDVKDIFISGSPQFRRRVEMGEARRTSGGVDKYASSISLFEGGIYFEQPNVRITDEAAVLSKINRFRDSTAVNYRFYPNGTANIATSTGISKSSAVQLEFYVQSGTGKVRITNNCTVKNCRRDSDDRTWDFKVTPGSGGDSFERYYIYAYHYGPNDVSCPSDKKQPPIVANIEDTYVSQTFAGYTSEPGGQIFVDGDVIIGGDNATDPNQVVKGKITVVASGNIWIGDNIIMDGTHDANGKPADDNPNVLGLIAKGVIKVIDPGIAGYSSSSTNRYPGQPPSASGYTIADVNAANCLKHTYKPVGNLKSSPAGPYDRVLPNPTIVEAAITVGGGGWGAENVTRNGYGGRKENPNGSMDNLVVRGSITECIRGVVGLPPDDGYTKQYYIDNRLMSGILPGDIWLTGKYIPSPAGWHDYRAN